MKFKNYASIYKVQKKFKDNIIDSEKNLLKCWIFYKYIIIIIKIELIYLPNLK